ncbi:MAG: hypothetical protein RLY21_765 [Planctomycetota bacterium]
MIVACSILVIVGTLALPRFLVVDSQREEKAVVAAEDLLRMFAFRTSAGLQQVSLHYMRESATLTLWIMDLNPADPEGPRVWQQDRLSSPVEFPEGLMIERALADGLPMTEDEWTITTNPDGSRPRIELFFAGKEKRAELVLESYSNSPIRADDPRARVLQPIDLDSEGSAYDPW